MMSNLQIGLAIAGGVVLAAVIAHGIWVSRRNAPRLPTPEQGQEPVADGLTDPLLGSDSGVGDGQAAPVAAVSPRRVELDGLIDVIAALALEPGAVVSGDAALAALPGTRRVGSKPFAVEGFHQSTQGWEFPRPGERYSAFQTGVQMANRSGPLNDIEFSEFVAKTQSFADAVGARAEFPDMLEAVARARELDQFAGAHDAQLGFTLRAQQASWSPGFVRQCAQRQGFVVSPVPGRMVLPSPREGQPPLVVLSYDSQAALADDPNQSALRQISLQLDVAQVDRAEQPYARMREATQALAQWMDAQVTDDLGQPLTEAAMDQVNLDLESLYDALAQRELAAGSPLAQRLFS